MMELEVSEHFSWKILKTDILNGASPFNSNSKGVQRQQIRIIKSQAESEPFFCFLNHRKHEKVMGPTSDCTTVTSRP